jgi:SAM-dependent methyltransferase
MVRRRRLGATLRRALTDPRHARYLVHRVGRDVRLRLRHRGDHVAYYRAVMQDTIQRGEATAVGHRSRKGWQKGGKRQFDYRVARGLRPEHRMLDIGCGNLRAGRRFIDHLDAGHYYGIDISPEAILSAQDTLEEVGLAAKVPYLTVVDDLAFGFLPDAWFDVVHAHSVFSHSPLAVVEQCFGHVGRILRPGGSFYFTFNRTDGRERNTLNEDFYYRTDTLLDAARRHGLQAEFMDDWEAMAPVQSTIRVWSDNRLASTGAAT